MSTCNNGLQLGGGPPPIPRSAGGGSSIPYVFSSSGVEQRDTSRDILKSLKKKEGFMDEDIYKPCELSLARN